MPLEGLTRAEYLDRLDEGFEAGRRAFAELVLSMPKEAFLAQAAAAWDRARQKYGPACDLHLRDLACEAGMEAVDGVVYVTLDT